MKTERTCLFLLASILVLSAPAQALACACCSNEGEYLKWSGKINEYELGLMKQMQFDKKAFLFLTEAGAEEDARGIINPKAEYSISGALVGLGWRLSFREGSTSGVLNLTLPLQMEVFKVDIHDGKQSGGGGPLLYKEWRLQGRVNGSGLFKWGIVGPTRYFLVLQGRGNSCDNAEDFTSWRLNVTGPKARYALYGKLDKPK